MVDGGLVFDTKIDTKGFNSGVNSLKQQTEGLSPVLKKIGRLIAAAFSVKTLINFGREAINLASDIEEVQNVVDVSFGKMSWKIEEFAETSVKSFGMSKLTAKRMASTFAAMANSMGQGLDTATDYAVEMTRRLGDIASFYNLSLERVETIGRAVYSGEMEPLKTLGVVMTETQLQIFALAKGYKTLYRDMSAADRLLVRQQYFLERTNLAAGDFVRTQDSWANQTKILSEQWKEFLSICGAGLINVLAPGVKALNSILEAMIAIGNTAAQVFGWGDKVAEITTASSEAEDSISDMADATTAASKKVSKGLAPFDELNVISQEIAQNSADSADFIEALGGASGTTVSVSEIQVDSKLAKDIREAGEAFSKFADAIKVFGSNAAKGFLNFRKDVGKISWAGIKVGFGAISDFLGGISPEAARGIGAGLGAIATAILTINGCKLVGDIITGLAGAILSLGPAGALLAVGTAIVAIAAGVREYREALQEKFEVSVLGETLDSMLTKYSAAVDELYTTIDKIHSTVEDAGSAEIAYARKLWTEYRDLHEQSELTNNEIAKLQIIGEQLEEYIPGFNAVISSETSTWEEQKQTIEELIAAKELMYKTNAAKGLIEESYANEITAQKELDEARSKIAQLGQARDEAWSSYYEIQKELDKIAEGEYKVSRAEFEDMVDAASEFYDKYKGLQSMIDSFMPTITQLEQGIKDAQATSEWLFTYILDAEMQLATATDTKSQEIKDSLVGNMSEAAEKAGGEIKNFADSVSDAADKAVTDTTESVGAGCAAITDMINGLSPEAANAASDVGKAFYTRIAEWVDAAKDKFSEFASVFDAFGGKPTILSKLEMILPSGIAMPKLATGTVVPANYGEFAAILGDNRREAEVVSPVSTMKQAFKEALAEMGGLGGGEYTFVAQLDGETVFRETVRQSKMYRKQYGTSAFT